MIIYLLIYYVLARNVSPHPVNSFPIQNVTTTSGFPMLFGSFALNSTLSDSSPVCNCNERSMLDIVWSCLSTLFLCSWASVHPNMPAPSDESWRVMWRRLKTMYWAIVGPEFVLMWAVRQLIGARMIFNKYKKEQHEWTMNHAHFLQMGGFHLRDGDNTSVLRPEKFYRLIDLKEISFPTITKEEIQDRSKADGLSKVVVSSQTLWFVIQCIGRHAQGLPLAQLEVTTLAVISCTFIFSIIWWHKPLDAKCPVYLERIKSVSPLPEVDNREENIARTEDVSHESPLSSASRDSAEFAGDLSRKDGNLSRNISDTANYHSISSSAINPYQSNGNNNNEAAEDVSAEDQVNHYLTIMIHKCFWFLKHILTPVTILWRSLLSIIRTVFEEVTSDELWRNGIFSGIERVFLIWPIAGPIIKFIGDDSGDDDTRVPSYFAQANLEASSWLMLIVASTAIFGTIHCIAWNYHFPSSTEKFLWRMSAIGVAATPTFDVNLVVISQVINSRTNWRKLVEHYIKVNLTYMLYFVGLICLPATYVFYRLYLLIEAVLSLRALPPSAFQTISWSNFIPHF